MSFPENAPALDNLPDIPAAELAALTGEMLAVLQYELDGRLARLQAVKARFEEAMALRYGERAADARRDAGKDTGTVRVADGDMTIVADLPKRVEWDQERLAEIAARIRAEGDDPTEYVETALKVSERKYAAWPEAIRSVFEPARTVRTGKPVFRIAEDGEARA